MTQDGSAVAEQAPERPGSIWRPVPAQVASLIMVAISGALTLAPLLLALVFWPLFDWFAAELTLFMGFALAVALAHGAFTVRGGRARFGLAWALTAAGGISFIVLLG